jgi:nitroimidazol reductase NimA-like FMN-containing flavoprotein (pyridoxamine 5'-phosphate oxidase superfamily)
MSDKPLEKTIVDYINQTKWATLATVRADNAPVLRVMGSFAIEGLHLFFSTRIQTAKVEQIELNPLVSFYFQHEGQDLLAFRNVTVIGPASRLESGPELNDAIKLLSDRNPRFKARIESEEGKDTAVYKIRIKEIKYLDYSLGKGKDAVRELFL